MLVEVNPLVVCCFPLQHAISIIGETLKECCRAAGRVGVTQARLYVVAAFYQSLIES